MFAIYGHVFLRLYHFVDTKFNRLTNFPILINRFNNYNINNCCKSIVTLFPSQLFHPFIIATSCAIFSLSSLCSFSPLPLIVFACWSLRSPNAAWTSQCDSESLVGDDTGQLPAADNWRPGGGEGLGRGKDTVSSRPCVTAALRASQQAPDCLGTRAVFVEGADSRLTPAVGAATLWPWAEEVKWSLWTLSSELSVASSLFLTCLGVWESWKWPGRMKKSSSSPASFHAKLLTAQRNDSTKKKKLEHFHREMNPFLNFFWVSADETLQKYIWCMRIFSAIDCLMMRWLCLKKTLCHPKMKSKLWMYSNSQLAEVHTECGTKKDWGTLMVVNMVVGASWSGLQTYWSDGCFVFLFFYTQAPLISNVSMAPKWEHFPMILL